MNNTPAETETYIQTLIANLQTEMNECFAEHLERALDAQRIEMNEAFARERIAFQEMLKPLLEAVGAAGGAEALKPKPKKKSVVEIEPLTEEEKKDLPPDHCQVCSYKITKEYLSKINVTDLKRACKRHGIIKYTLSKEKLVELILEKHP